MTKIRQKVSPPGFLFFGMFICTRQREKKWREKNDTIMEEMFFVILESTTYFSPNESLLDCDIVRVGS